MASIDQDIQDANFRNGLIAGIIAYTIWGFFPVYFVVTNSVGALELLAHRVVWSVPFGALIIVFRRQWAEVFTALRTSKVVWLILLSSITMAGNWGVFIWAIQQGYILQSSLGYYINPLMYVLAGVIFFGERLSQYQKLAVFLAIIGVTILAVYGGVFPWISLFLATSFTIYGIIRKQVDVGAMPGLFLETLFLLPIALMYIFWLLQSGTLDFTAQGPEITALLLLAGPITVMPLLFFAVAARKLPLTMLGFLQYIGPTLHFACALYYGEAFTTAHAWCFGFIWLAVAIFSWDALRKRSKTPKRLKTP